MPLADLPPERHTREYIESAIRYEESPGIHTYHDCKCGRSPTRSGRCATCWREFLAELENEQPTPREDEAEVAWLSAKNDYYATLSPHRLYSKEEGFLRGYRAAAVKYGEELASSKAGFDKLLSANTDLQCRVKELEAELVDARDAVECWGLWWKLSMDGWSLDKGVFGRDGITRRWHWICRYDRNGTAIYASADRVFDSPEAAVRAAAKALGITTAK